MEKFEAALRRVRERTPLVQCITNFVTVNDCANILLASGASPTMAHDIREAAEAVTGADALVCNMGAIEDTDAMILAGKQANRLGKPVILDPVAAGGTALRRESAGRLLSEIHFAVIRGNASEIMSVAGTAAPTRGVESTQPSGNAIHAARKLAKDIKGPVCVSGATDHIFDSTGRKASLDNGHIWMTRITGAGCSASAMIGAFAAIQPDYWQAVTAAMAYMGIAGELAAETVISQNLGVGSMQTALLDKLQLMNKNEFLTRLKISANA